MWLTTPKSKIIEVECTTHLFKYLKPLTAEYSAVFYIFEKHIYHIQILEVHKNNRKENTCLMNHEHWIIILFLSFLPLNYFFNLRRMQEIFSKLTFNESAFDTPLY